MQWDLILFSFINNPLYIYIYLSAVRVVAGLGNESGNTDKERNLNLFFFFLSFFPVISLEKAAVHPGQI